MKINVRLKQKLGDEMGKAHICPVVQTVFDLLKKCLEEVQGYKKAYKRAQLMLHPDKNPCCPDDAVKVLNRVDDEVRKVHASADGRDLNEVDVEKLYKIFVSIKECKKDKSGKKYVYPGFEEFPCVQCEKEAKHATDIARFEADLAKYRELGLITNYDFIMRVKAEFGTSQSLPLTSLQNSAESSVTGMTRFEVLLALGKIENDIKAGADPGSLHVYYNPNARRTTEGVISVREFEKEWNEVLGPYLKASSSSSAAAPTLHDFFASVPDEMKVKVPGPGPSGEPEVLFDTAIIPDFCEKYLGIKDVNKEVWEQLLAFPDHPVDEPIAIERDNTSWITGDHSSLHYRGNAVKRGKIWLQSKWDKGMRRYRYSGWQWRVSGGTKDISNVPAVESMFQKASQAVHQEFNAVIATRYVGGEDNIGEHSDKTDDWYEDSCFIVIKLGDPRPFEFSYEGKTIYSKVLQPGTAVIVGSAANKMVKHSVPSTDDGEDHVSGSLVGRWIKTLMPWSYVKTKIKEAERSMQKRELEKKEKKTKKETLSAQQDNSCDTDSDNAGPDDDDHGDEDEGKRKKPSKMGKGKPGKKGKRKRVIRISSDEEEEEKSDKEEHKEKNKGRTHSRIAA
jgi:hypothetical protein